MDISATNSSINNQFDIESQQNIEMHNFGSTQYLLESDDKKKPGFFASCKYRISAAFANLIGNNQSYAKLIPDNNEEIILDQDVRTKCIRKRKCLAIAGLLITGAIAGGVITSPFYLRRSCPDTPNKTNGSVLSNNTTLGSTPSTITEMIDLSSTPSTITKMTDLSSTSSSTIGVTDGQSVAPFAVFNATKIEAIASAGRELMQSFLQNTCIRW